LGLFSRHEFSADGRQALFNTQIRRLAHSKQIISRVFHKQIHRFSVQFCEPNDFHFQQFNRLSNHVNNFSCFFFVAYYYWEN